MSLPIRPNVLSMEPYSPGKPIDEVKRELGLTEVVKLASNENPLGPSPAAVKAVQEAATRMHLYPDASAFELTRAIAAHVGVEPNQIMVGNGSDELIHMIGQVFLGEPGDEMIVGDPSFVRYDAAAFLATTKLVKVPVDASLTINLDAMLAAVTPRTKIIWIANPNNPTATIVRRAAFEKFLNALPDGIVVVLDEAYYEFAADEADYPSSVDYVKAGRNVIGLRTFSKAFGLAGIRLGYGIAPAAVVDAFHRAREPFNCNALAQVAAMAALGDKEHVRKTVELNAAGRAKLEAALRESGAKPVESFANFVLADLGVEAHPVFEALLRKGVIVRSGKGLGLPTYLRISVGTADEVDAFINAYREVGPVASE